MRGRKSAGKVKKNEKGCEGGLKNESQTRKIIARFQYGFSKEHAGRSTEITRRTNRGTPEYYLVILALETCRCGTYKVRVMGHGQFICYFSMCDVTYLRSTEVSVSSIRRNLLVGSLGSFID